MGSFRLVGRLHVGARGRTYLGRSGSGQPVVVRVFDPAWIAACGGRMPLAVRLARARLVGSPRVARVVDAQVRAGGAYLVAEYVEGPTLADVVRSHGPLPADPLRHLAICVLAGLAAVHEVRLAYGDLTPGSSGSARMAHD